VVRPAIERVTQTSSIELGLPSSNPVASFSVTALRMLALDGTARLLEVAGQEFVAIQLRIPVRRQLKF
jgi:hypothetical protein